MLRYLHFLADALRRSACLVKPLPTCRKLTFSEKNLTNLLHVSHDLGNIGVVKAEVTAR